MALLQLSQMSGAEQVFTSTLASALASSLISSAPIGASMTFWTAALHPASFTRLMYDAHEDALLVCNGQYQNPTFTYHPIVGSAVSIVGIGRQPVTQVLLRGDTLHPAGSAGTGGDIVAKGASQQYMPGSGGGTGFSWDPNTDSVYQHFWQFGTNARRGGGTALPYGYGYLSMLSTTDVALFGGWRQVTWDGAVTGEQFVASAMFPNAGGRAGKLSYIPAFYWPPIPAVLLNDVAVFVYADWPGHGWISCRKRPVTTAANWRGTRSMPFGWPMALCPMGVDRVIAVWWSYPGAGAPLVYTVFRYDRAVERLRLEDVGTVPTTYTYIYPGHVGYAAYDTRRGRLLLLSPNPTDVHALTLDNFCHPGIPRSATTVVALDPTHAGYEQRYAALTYTTVTTLASPRITVSYPGFASTDTSRSTGQFATNGLTGTGTFAVSWASGASGACGAITIGFSTYSVGLSATYSQGVAYGTEGMALLTSTATFTVSTTLSAATATSVVANVIIQPRIPVSQADAVGAGTPRELSYPTSALATPYVYGMNPHTWNGMGASPFTSPLYANTRTLQKTVLAQFAGDVTDLEVTETWIGGGPQRIAMALSQFAAMFEIFQNPPDLASAGYVTWSPKDISNRRYQVIITSLTVGGQDGVMLNHMYKAGGWISETVEMKMRIIAEV